MQLDLNRVIEQVSKEKGIDKQIVVKAVEEMMHSAAKRTFGADRKIESRRSPAETCNAHISLGPFRTATRRRPSILSTRMHQPLSKDHHRYAQRDSRRNTASVEDLYGGYTRRPIENRDCM